MQETVPIVVVFCKLEPLFSVNCSGSQGCSQHAAHCVQHADSGHEIWASQRQVLHNRGQSNIRLGISDQNRWSESLKWLAGRGFTQNIVQTGDIMVSRWSAYHPRLCQPELLVAAEPAAVGECTSEMWVGLAQLNIAQQLYSAYQCTAGWM